VQNSVANSKDQRPKFDADQRTGSFGAVSLYVNVGDNGVNFLTHHRAELANRCTATQPLPSASQSSTAFDNLRGFVILIVVAFHSFLAYLESNPSSPPLAFNSPPYHWKAVPISDSARWFGFDLFCASQYVYLMQFMFFLSGLFVWPSLRRKGARTYLADRARRIGVPFILGVYLLMPLAHYPVYRVAAADPSWSAFWAQWVSLPFWPTGPLWFLGCLLGLDIVAAALFRLEPDIGHYFGSKAPPAHSHPGGYFISMLALSARGLCPIGCGFQTLGLDSVWPIRFSGKLCVTLCSLFFCRPCYGSVWDRARSVGVRRRACTRLGNLGCHRIRRIYCVDRYDCHYHS
jgi:hypothetical protein